MLDFFMEFLGFLIAIVIGFLGFLLWMGASKGKTGAMRGVPLIVMALFVLYIVIFK